MVVQEDLMPESLVVRWLTFYKKPALLEESYEMVMLRIGFLLFAALLFRLILAGGELRIIWALVALVFSLLVCLLLMKGLTLLLEIKGTSRLMCFGLGMGILAALIIVFSLV